MTDHLEMALGPEEDVQTIGSSSPVLRKRVLRTADRAGGAAEGRGTGSGTASGPTDLAVGTGGPAATAGPRTSEDRTEGRTALPVPRARAERAAEVLWPRWTRTRRAVRWIEGAGGAVRSGTDRGAEDRGPGRDLDAALRTLDRTVEREARCYDAGYTLY